MMMKVIRIFAIVILTILVVGFFFPKINDFEKTIYTEASPETVYELVSNLEKWPEWSPWIRVEPDMKIEFGEIRKGLGAKYSWEGEEMGAGSLWISDVEVNKRIVTNIDFGGGQPSQGIFTLTPTDAGTTVGWRFINTNGWDPVSRLIGGLFIQPMVEDSYVEGLGFLNEVAIETERKNASVEFNQIRDKEGISYIGIKVPLPNDLEISAKIGELFGKLMVYAQSNNIQVVGMPMTLYYTNEDGSLDMECALPTADQITLLNTEIKSGVTPTGDLVKGIHMGAYSELPNTYAVMNNYISTSGYQQSGPSYEIYVTDPGVVTDTALWQTDVYIPLIQ